MARLRELPGDLIDPANRNSHRVCIVKRTAGSGLIEFCVVDAEHHPVWVLNGSLCVLTGLQ